MAAVHRATTVAAALSTPKITAATSAALAASVASTQKKNAASAASAVVAPAAAAAIESVKSAGDWKTLLKSHQEFKETYRRAMSDGRSSVPAPAASAPPSVCPPYRFANDPVEADQSASSSHWKPAPAAPMDTVAAPSSTTAVAPPSARLPYRFEYDPVEDIWNPAPAAPKAAAVVSASSAAREFAAAAASPRPVFQASSSDSSEEDDEEDDDYGPVAPFASAGDGRTELMDRFNQAMSGNPSLVKKLESIRSLSNLSHASMCEADTPVYTLSVGHKVTHSFIFFIFSLEDEQLV